MTDIKDVLLADQQKGQADNTAARKALKEERMNSWGVRIAIGIAIALIFFFLAFAGNWNFFWLLAMSAGLWVVGSKLAGLKEAKAILWYWPIALQGLAVVVALGTIGTSGFTKLLEVGANSLETAVDCYADPNQAKCITKPSSQPRTANPSASVTAPPTSAAPSVVVPACGNGWSTVVNIPAYWNVTSAWNMDTVQAAWRENGEWKQFPGKYLSGSFDAVKYCAKISSYAGEEMLLTWSQR